MKIVLTSQNGRLETIQPAAVARPEFSSHLEVSASEQSYSQSSGFQNRKNRYRKHVRPIRADLIDTDLTIEQSSEHPDFHLATVLA